MLEKGGIVFLPCTDISKTVSFFRDTLGLPAVMKQSDTLYIFDTGRGYWGFSQYQDHRPPLSGPKGACLSLNYDSIEDVNNEYLKLKDSCRILQEPRKHPVFPVWSFFISGPDDYLIEFQTVNIKTSDADI